MPVIIINGEIVNDFDERAIIWKREIGMRKLEGELWDFDESDTDSESEEDLEEVKYYNYDDDDDDKDDDAVKVRVRIYQK